MRWRNEHARTVLARAGFVLALLAYALAAVRLSPPRHRILIPADRPTRVVDPMRVELVDDAGRPGLRNPPDAGRGWCNEAGGAATYTCNIPGDGTYTLWAHCNGSGPARTPCTLASTARTGPCGQRSRVQYIGTGCAARTGRCAAERTR